MKLCGLLQNAFGHNIPGRSPYGYTLANSGTMLSSDATLALLQAGSNRLIISKALPIS
jgi:hypothetical protein